jgi:hypothetical protein
VEFAEGHLEESKPFTLKPGGVYEQWERSLTTDRRASLYYVELSGVYRSSCSKSTRADPLG